MRKNLLLPLLCFLACHSAIAQRSQHDTIPIVQPAKATAQMALAEQAPRRPWRLSDQKLWIEVDAILNPIYITQFSTHYKLNGTPLNKVSILPKFYAVTPAQLPFGNLNEILDQSNALYFNFRMLFLDKWHIGWLHDTRLVIGFTHDKLQTGSDSIHYKYDDGGTEFSIMLQKQFFTHLSDLDFDKAGLIFSVNVQYGMFVSLAQIKSHMSWKDTVITQQDNSRWAPGSGWGWLAATHIEFGRAFGRFVLTLGTKFLAEGLYSSDKVIVNNVPGSKLKVNNYGLFFVGPMINLKYLIP